MDTNTRYSNHSTTRKVDQALTDYRFNEAASTLYHFVWGTFCDWYLEFTKPLLNDEDARLETQATTGWVLDQILLLLNPFMPFVTEELFAKLTERQEGERLISSQWPSYPESHDKPEAVEEITWLRQLISEIRSVRADMRVPAGASVALLVKGASATTLRRLDDYEEVISKMARLSEIRPLQGDIPSGSIQSVLNEATLVMPIAELIDLDQERGRLSKEIERLQKEIKQIDGKLSNQGFIKNAPEEVIEEQNRRKSEAESTLSKFSSALEQLSAA